MKVSRILITIACFAVLACVVIYFVPSNTKTIPKNISENGQDIKETDTPIDNTNPLSDVTTQQEKSHTDAQKKSDMGKQDWMKEPTPEELSKKFGNPWKGFELTDTLLDDEIETTEVNITDPSSYDALRKEMVSRHGDTNAVESYMDTWLKAVSNPDNIEYKAKFATAAYELSPSPETKKSMEIINAIVNNDYETLKKYSEPAESNSKFQDVQRYFVGVSNHADGFRNLRTSNPKRSAEFEKFILEQARRDPGMDFEKIRRDIESSYTNEIPEAKSLE